MSVSRWVFWVIEYLVIIGIKCLTDTILQRVLEFAAKENIDFRNIPDNEENEIRRV